MNKRKLLKSIPGILLIYFLSAFISVYGQETSSDTKVKVKIVTEKDGKKEVVEKTYNSIAEFEADESVQLEQFEDIAGMHTIDITKETEGKKVIKIQKEQKEVVLVATRNVSKRPMYHTFNTLIFRTLFTPVSIFSVCAHFVCTVS